MKRGLRGGNKREAGGRVKGEIGRKGEIDEGGVKRGEDDDQGSEEVMSR